VTGTVFSPEDLRETSRPALELGGADGVEIVFTGSRTGLTRYANSQIIQNTVQSVARAYVRVVSGLRFSVASTNRFHPDSLVAASERALEAARQSPEDPEFPGLPNPADVGTASAVMRFDEDTATATPQRRARAVAEILKVAGDHDAAGIYETSSHAFAVFSSAGIDCFDAYTRCVANLIIASDDATGYREASSHEERAIDVEALANEAFEKLRRSEHPAKVTAGRYEVVLEPAAVAMLLEYLSYMGMGAKQVLDGESFLSSRSDQMVADQKVTVADDVYHPLSVGIGFDLEGVPKKRVAVIDGGRAIGPVTDLRTSRLMGAPLTGHYSGSNEFGPYASNVVMNAGSSPLEELVGAVDDGLLVTRLHYVNVLDRPATLLTGMTRDGTWRIRGGELTTPVHNLRFTQSVLEALGSAQGLGRDLAAFAPDFGGFGSNVAPALHCGEFSFTSTTSH
jgi:PmbA protein